MNYVLRNYAKLSHFNYDKNGKDWKVEAGKQQSPISLAKEKAVRSSAPRLTFVNYDKTFGSPLKLTNNGHTITMAIPPGADGSQPALCGCMLESIYKAVQLHFHWGSPHSEGSEHEIEFSRYDAEVHIVHQNCAYGTKQEAICAPDGYVVLGLMLKIAAEPVINPKALNKVCMEASQVKKYDMSSTFKGEFSLRDILAGIERQEFFTYQGSLTTPPCSEVVNWFVFPKPIEISKRYLKHLWNLSDDRGRPLLNNFRELQDLHERNVYYRNQMWPKT